MCVGVLANEFVLVCVAMSVLVCTTQCVNVCVGVHGCECVLPCVLMSVCWRAW